MAEIGVEIGVEIGEVRERRQRRTRAITRPLAEEALSVTARGQLQRGRENQVDMHAREGQRRLGRVSHHQPGERPEQRGRQAVLKRDDRQSTQELHRAGRAAT